MATATVGQNVWYMSLQGRTGPFPGIVLTAGSEPIVLVHFPETDQRIKCTHWLEEDGSFDGWLEIPSELPADLFD